jgi:hypothetical protein
MLKHSSSLYFILTKQRENIKKFSCVFIFCLDVIYMFCFIYSLSTLAVDNPKININNLNIKNKKE